MKAALGWIKKLNYMMIRFKKQRKELPAPIWLMIRPFSLPLWAPCLSLRKAQPPPHHLRRFSGGICMERGVRSLQGQGWWQLSSWYSVPMCQYCSAGMSLLSCVALSGLNAHSVGGSAYRAKHSLTFLLKRVGSGFYILIFFFNLLLHAVRVLKGQIIVVDFCLPLW